MPEPVSVPELEALPLGSIISNPALRHLRGLNVYDQALVYWLNDGERLPYSSVEVYNSWNLDNDFSRVVPANAADLNLPVGNPTPQRMLCGK